MSAYLTFFELESSPFDTKTPSNLVLGTKALRSAYSQVERGLEDGSPRICVSAKAGMGKTSLARALPKLLGDKARSVLLLNPALPWVALRAAIVKQWDLEDGALSRKSLMKAISTGGRLVLIIDQAECISRESLEHLDILLSYLVDDDQQIVHCVLFANLEQAAAEDDCALLWWLDQLTTLQLEFSPIPASGVASYIHKHLKRAGWKGDNLFTPEACNAIHYMTGGVPRAVSKLCERALEEAARRNFRQVEPALIEEVCGEVPAGSAGYGDATADTAIEPLGPPITTPVPDESSVVNALADQSAQAAAMDSSDRSAEDEATNASIDESAESSQSDPEEGYEGDKDDHATSHPSGAEETGIFKPVNAPISLDSFFGSPPAEPEPAIAPLSVESTGGSGRKRRLAIAATILILGGAGGTSHHLGLLDSLPADETAREGSALTEQLAPSDPSPVSPETHEPKLAVFRDHKTDSQGEPAATDPAQPKPETLTSATAPASANTASSEPKPGDAKALAQRTAAEQQAKVEQETSLARSANAAGSNSADAPANRSASPVPASPAPAVDRSLPKAPPAAPMESPNPADVQDSERYW